MILLQLSAAQGPLECQLAVAKALEVLQVEAKAGNIEVALLDAENGERKGTFKSVLCSLDGVAAEMFAKQWCGSMLWQCQSPYRPTHKRKNWYFGGTLFEPGVETAEGDIRYQYCRSSGAGGQHVNKTDSAVRATHLASGISVRVESQRSQHANKKLARLLIAQKLEEQAQNQHAEQDRQRHQHHQKVERGNAGRTFKGMRFIAQ